MVSIKSGWGNLSYVVLGCIFDENFHFTIFKYGFSRVFCYLTQTWLYVVTRGAEAGGQCRIA